MTSFPWYFLPLASATPQSLPMCTATLIPDVLEMDNQSLLMINLNPIFPSRHFPTIHFIILLQHMIKPSLLIPSLTSFWFYLFIPRTGGFTRWFSRSVSLISFPLVSFANNFFQIIIFFASSISLRDNTLSRWCGWTRRFEISSAVGCLGDVDWAITIYLYVSFCF